MSNFRMGFNTTEHYTSLVALRESWGCKPVSKTTKDMNKLKEQQERFNKKHLCSNCKQPMEWIPGTNVCACKNPSCKGIKHEYIDSTGETKVYYEVSSDLLSELGIEIATNIFV